MGIWGQEKVGRQGGKDFHPTEGTPVIQSWGKGGEGRIERGWLTQGKAAVSRCCPEVPAPAEAGSGGEWRRT